jgi:hypothetical protein
VLFGLEMLAQLNWESESADEGKGCVHSVRRSCVKSGRLRGKRRGGNWMSCFSWRNLMLFEAVSSSGQGIDRVRGMVSIVRKRWNQSLVGTSARTSHYSGINNTIEMCSQLGRNPR